MKIGLFFSSRLTSSSILSISSSSNLNWSYGWFFWSKCQVFICSCCLNGTDENLNDFCYCWQAIPFSIFEVSSYILSKSIWVFIYFILSSYLAQHYSSESLIQCKVSSKFHSLSYSISFIRINTSKTQFFSSDVASNFSSVEEQYVNLNSLESKLKSTLSQLIYHRIFKQNWSL